MAKSREKFDINGLYESVRKKKFSPVYFFYGEERFLVDECVDAIIEHAVDPGMKEFNFDVLQGSEVDANKVLAIAASYPMMADRRVIILKEFERTLKKGTEELYVQYFENPSPTTVMVIIANNPDFRKKPYTTLKTHAVVGEFRPYYENETIAWIESRVKKFGRTIDPTAAALLHSYVGSSLRELDNEIEKLTIAAGDAKTIAAANVERVVGVSREFTVFELANMVGEKNIAKSLEIADRLIRSGESAVPVIAALTTHFIKLYKLHDAVRQRRADSELSKVIGVHQFFMKDYLSHIKKYSPAEIERVFLLLAEADLAVKSSSDQNRVLTKVIAEIINGSPRNAETA